MINKEEIGLFSIYAVPPKETADLLREKIAEVCTKYNVPPIEPHVTLVWDIERRQRDIEETVARIASELPPAEIVLNEIQTGPSYFRCVYLKGIETPELVKNVEILRRAFGREGDPPFLCHLSLFYGELDPANKERIAKEFALPLPIKFNLDEIQLFTGGGRDPRNWKLVKRFSPGGAIY